MMRSSSSLLLLVVLCLITGPHLTAAIRSCHSCEGTKGGHTCNDPFNTVEALAGVVPKVCNANQPYCYKLHNPDKSFDRGCTDETCPDPREAAKGDAWFKVNYCSVCKTDMCNAAVRPAGASAALLAALLAGTACLQFPWLRRAWWA
jgi:hypothetical protein